MPARLRLWWVYRGDEGISQSPSKSLRCGPGLYMCMEYRDSSTHTAQFPELFEDIYVVRCSTAWSASEPRRYQFRDSAPESDKKLRLRRIIVTHSSVVQL